MGGRFTLSCDSHGISQVGLNFDKTVEKNIRPAGITELYHLTSASVEVQPHDTRFPSVGWKSMSVDALESHPFFHQLPGKVHKQ
jgi:histidinol-phosphatase (PHP family)